MQAISKIHLTPNSSVAPHVRDSPLRGIHKNVDRELIQNAHILPYMLSFSIDSRVLVPLIFSWNL